MAVERPESWLKSIWNHPLSRYSALLGGCTTGAWVASRPRVAEILNRVQPHLVRGFQAGKPYAKHVWDNPGSSFIKFTLVTVLAANALNKLGIISPATARDMKDIPVTAGRTLGEGLGLTVRATGPVIASTGLGALHAMKEGASEVLFNNNQAHLNKAQAQEVLGGAIAAGIKSGIAEVFEGLKNGLKGAVIAITPTKWQEAAAKVRNAVQNVPTGNMLLGTACGALAIYGTYRFVYPSPQEKANKAKNAPKQGAGTQPELKDQRIADQQQLEEMIRILEAANRTPAPQPRQEKQQPIKAVAPSDPTAISNSEGSKKTEPPKDNNTQLINLEISHGN